MLVGSPYRKRGKRKKRRRKERKEEVGKGGEKDEEKKEEETENKDTKGERSERGRGLIAFSDTRTYVGIILFPSLYPQGLDIDVYLA